MDSPPQGGGQDTLSYGGPVLDGYESSRIHKRVWACASCPPPWHSPSWRMTRLPLSTAWHSPQHRQWGNVYPKPSHPTSSNEFWQEKKTALGTVTVLDHLHLYLIKAVPWYQRCTIQRVGSLPVSSIGLLWLRFWSNFELVSVFLVCHFSWIFL